MKKLVLAKTHKEYTGTAGLYSSCDIENLADLLGYCDRIGLAVTGVDEFHCTVIYAPERDNQLTKENVLRLRTPNAPEATVIGLEMFGPNEDTLVLLLNSPELAQISNKWVQQGFKPTFPEYRPHITVRTDTSATEEELETVRSRIQTEPLFSVFFKPEVLEDIKD